MTGNIRGDFKSTYFQEIEKDVSKLEKGLKPVNTSGVLGLGRKFVHQFGAGFEKLARAITGHGWISREEATTRKIDQTVKNLTEVHQQLKIAYRSSKVSTDAYKKFNEEVIDQLEKMSQICMLARTKLGKKISEKGVHKVEENLGKLIDSCSNAIEEAQIAKRKAQIVQERKEAKARPREPVTEPIKGVKNRLEKELAKKEAREAGIAKAKEEHAAMPKVPKGMTNKLREQLERRDEKFQLDELGKLAKGLDAEAAELEKMIEKEKLDDVEFGRYQRAGEGEDPFLSKAEKLEKRSLAGLKSELEQISSRPKNIKIDAVNYKLQRLLDRMPLENIEDDKVLSDAAKLSRMVAGGVPTTAKEATKFFEDIRLLFMSVSGESEGIDRAVLSQQIRQIENDAKSIYE